jgi:hypothetical protein
MHEVRLWHFVDIPNQSCECLLSRDQQAFTCGGARVSNAPKAAIRRNRGLEVTLHLRMTINIIPPTLLGWLHVLSRRTNIWKLRRASALGANSATPDAVATRKAQPCRSKPEFDLINNENRGSTLRPSVSRRATATTRALFSDKPFSDAFADPTGCPVTIATFPSSWCIDTSWRPPEAINGTP